MVRGEPDTNPAEEGCSQIEEAPLLLNWFRTKEQFCSGIVEGSSNKAKLTIKKADGFRTYHVDYHALGALPIPKTTHECF